MIVSSESLYNSPAMAKFDSTKTRELDDLFKAPREQRDNGWKERFYSAVVDASMATTPQQVLRGPDGFPYFVLNLPPAGEPFETFCVSHVLDVCLDNGFGIVIQPDGNPQWVFTYGNLWSLKEFGNFEIARSAQPLKEQDGSPGERPTAAVGGKLQPVLVGQPSASLFPPFARKTIKNFLEKSAGSESAKVLLLNDAREEPQQALVFPVFVEDFADPSDFERVMYRLTWFFPSHYRLATLAKGSDLNERFEPL
jgi:hypothetical protein